MNKTQLKKEILKKELIHYGSKSFNIRKFIPIKNVSFEKPMGGLWTSPTKSTYGFNEYNKGTNVRSYKSDEFFKLRLKSDAKILIIDSNKDLSQVPHITLFETEFFSHKVMDFEKIAKEYDAIWLTINGLVTNREFTHKSYRLLAWDCETVLILNPDCFYKQRESEFVKIHHQILREEIIESLKLGHNHKETVIFLNEKGIKTSVSAIEKHVNKIKSEYNANSLFHLGYILGKNENKNHDKRA